MPKTKTTLLDALQKAGFASFALATFAAADPTGPLCTVVADGWNGLSAPACDVHADRCAVPAPQRGRQVHAQAGLSACTSQAGAANPVEAACKAACKALCAAGIKPFGVRAFAAVSGPVIIIEGVPRQSMDSASGGTASTPSATEPATQP